MNLNHVQKGTSVLAMLALIATSFAWAPSTAQAATIFSDGFESNSFVNWTIADSDWDIINDAHAGSRAAEVKDTGSSDDELTKNISTSGYQSIVLSYWYKIPAGLASDDELYVQWWDGSVWQTLVNYDSSATVSNWVQATHNLPAGANNLASFKIRFLGDSLSTSDKFRLDDVNLSGTAIPVEYTLTVVKAGTGTGYVQSDLTTDIDCGSDCSDPFVSGSVVELFATADAGSVFAGWSGACAGTGSCFVTMNAAKTVTATFNDIPDYTLSVTKAGTGTGTVTSDISGISCGADCSESYPDTTLVELFQVADAGSVFAGWSGACTGTGSCFVTMNAAKTVTATFNVIPEYTLTVVKNGTGSGYVRSDLLTDIDCGSDCSDPFTENALVELFQTANPGSVFAGWSGACTGTGSCFVTMSAAKTVTATFNDLPACSDGSDNDEDTKTDYPSDLGCESANDDDESDPAPTKAYVHTAKVICDDEQYLPNWGNNGPSITATSATDWVEESDGHCYLAKSWEFQWAPAGKDDDNPGDNVEEAGSPWTTFSGVLELLNPNGAKFWFREVLPEGWLEFTGDLTSPYNDVSAEMYCHTDVLHYDNYDFINSVVAGESYYCVAFNVAPAEEPVSCSVGTELLTNGGFEFPVVTNSSNWDIFPGTTVGLGWLVAWTNPSGAPAVANLEIQEDGLNGWSTPFGAQWAELDGHWGGPNAGVIISQDIPTEVGATYTFSFDFAARPDASSAAQNTVEVLVEGSVVNTISTSNTAWTPQSFSFTATDTLTTVAIRYAGTPNDSLGAFVDNASAKCTADACVGEEKTLTVVSDATTKVGENNAVLLTPQPGGTIHPAWTASIPGASWIWSSEPLPNASSEVTETFTKTFSIAGTPDSASLMIAADNSYEVFVNGSTTPSCADATEFNYSAGGQDLCNIPAWAFVNGNNTLTFKVKNLAQGGGTPSSNPAGLLYKLTVDYTTSCDESEEDTGTLIINKVTEGGDGTFWFDIDEEYGEEVLFKVLEDEGGDASVTTEEGEGSTSEELEEGWYTVSEIVPEGWNLESVHCTYEGEESEGEIIEDGYGYEIYIEEGETVTCTFVNEADEEWDTCPNLEGIQTSVPKGYHHDNFGSCEEDSGGGGRSGSSSNNNGSVLGETTCGPLLTQYLNIAWDNDESEVTKLQQFLNENLGLTLPATGLFGTDTFEAVKQFQVKYGSEVLNPWIGFPGSGIDGANDPSGFVYQTTRWQINNLFCPGSEAFPELI